MHDAKGRELRVGDIVIVPMRIRSIGGTKDFCNCDLESVATMPPAHSSRATLAAINTAQAIRANPGDDASFVAVRDGAAEYLREQK